MMSKPRCQQNETPAHKYEIPSTAMGKRGAPGSASVSLAARAQRRARVRGEHTKDNRTSSPRFVRIASLAQQARRLRSQGYALRQMCVATLCLLAMLAMAHAQDVQPLLPNTLLERELTSTQTHTYRILLKAGQFVHFDVFQKSIDVVLTLTAPDGKQIAEVDLPGFGMPESLSEIATSSGDYQLAIRSFGASKLKGQYQLKAEVKDAATDADKKRMTAERLLWDDGKLLTDPAKRLENARQAQVQWAELGERFWEADTLSRIGFAYNTLGEKEKAFAMMEEALKIMREIKSRAGEATILADLGGLARGTPESARRYFEQAITIFQEIRDATGAARAYTKIGMSFMPQQVEKAIPCFEKAFALARESQNNSLQMEALNALGTLKFMSGKPDESLRHAEEAVQLAQTNKDKVWELTAIDALSSLYSLKDQAKALELLNSGLALAREIKNRRGEAIELIRIAEIYTRQKRYDDAHGYFEQAIKISRESKEVGVEGWALLSLGTLQRMQSEYEKAMESFQAAFALHRNLKDFFVLDQIRISIGSVYRDLKQYEKALEHHFKAIDALNEQKAPTTYLMNAYAELMKDYQAIGQPENAIFFGKQCVNRMQEIRHSFRNFIPELLRSTRQSNETAYHVLADLLISQGRLPEAEQVLRMLKEEEYFEYIRGDADTPKGEKAMLTPKEEAADKRYREVADKLAALGAERAALLNKPSRTAEENKRLAQIEADLAVAGDAFQKFLDKLNDELKTTKDAGKVSQLRDTQGMMEDLRELGHGAVALYTVVGEDTFSIVLTTADVQKAYQVPIKAADLNRKVLAFRAALQNPTLDPLPLAQELYRTLLAPVEKDLQSAKAELLMWSLDGVLRYVPMAALHDGEKYLVERYRHSVFTPVSNARLKDGVSRNWKALGLGVTKAHGENVPALPGVAEEMRGIIKAEGRASGVLPGTIKLDEQFTEESMLTGLRERNNVVHIASHFRFLPGNETNSSLLLGDGNFLSLAQIKTWQNPFGGVELLTLSACNTALGNSGGGSGANGKEVEGFGVLAQQKGAKAVVASLWPVADRSTMRLMQEFYQRRESGLSKAEAMRQAQSKMLRGELAITTVSLTRSIVHETDTAAGLPKFKADAGKPFAHPYYWAPFILIGNWK